MGLDFPAWRIGSLPGMPQHSRGYQHKEVGEGNLLYGTGLFGRVSFNDSTISWILAKQKIVGLSSIKGKYVAACHTTKDLTWMK